MLQTIEKVPMRSVLDKFGIKYSQIGYNSFGLWENDKLTDGWIMHVSGNYVNDFSGKNRAIGGPFSFVKSYLTLTNKETFKWFEDCFNIKNQKSYAFVKHKKTKDRGKIRMHYNRTW